MIYYECKAQMEELPNGCSALKITKPTREYEVTVYYSTENKMKRFTI